MSLGSFFASLAFGVFVELCNAMQHSWSWGAMLGKNFFISSDSLLTGTGKKYEQRLL